MPDPLILDGCATAEALLADLGGRVARLRRGRGAIAGAGGGDSRLRSRQPSLCRIEGSDRDCAGPRLLQARIARDASEEELLALIARLNTDATVDGILVQLPLPAHIATDPPHLASPASIFSAPPEPPITSGPDGDLE